MPDLTRIMAAMQATWPPRAQQACGPFTLRDGAGGGKRVSAATLERASATAAQIAAAEDAMRAVGQVPLFRIDLGQQALDSGLAARGYAQVDPTVLCHGPIGPIAALPLAGKVAQDDGPVVITATAPVAAMRQIWAQGDIGPERLAVMARADVPRAWLLGRVQNRPAGCAFVGLWDGLAMVHALEVTPAARRCGLARALMIHAAGWAAGQGATQMALAVTRANAGALALYAGLGIAEAGGYHYRQAKA